MHLSSYFILYASRPIHDGLPSIVLSLCSTRSNVFVIHTSHNINTVLSSTLHLTTVLYSVLYHVIHPSSGLLIPHCPRVLYLTLHTTLYASYYPHTFSILLTQYSVLHSVCPTRHTEFSVYPVFATILGQCTLHIILYIHLCTSWSIRRVLLTAFTSSHATHVTMLRMISACDICRVLSPCSIIITPYSSHNASCIL